MSDDLFDICERKHGGNPNSVAANERIVPSKDAVRARVLEVVRLHSQITLAELAEMWGVEKNTISGRFSELKTRGLIEQRGRRDGCGIWRLCR